MADQIPPVKRMYKSELADILGYAYPHHLVSDVLKLGLLDKFNTENDQHFTEREFRKAKKLTPSLCKYILEHL